MQTATAGSKPKHVLLVEDSLGDVRLTQEVFRETNPNIRLHVACDGVEAMAFLRREGRYLHAPRPDIILLDLNLPKMDGREVLAIIKKDEDLKIIPTIVLTTSDQEADIESSYQLQVNCYIQKPEQWDKFESLVKSVVDFWLLKVKLPPYAVQATRASTADEGKADAAPAGWQTSEPEPS